MVCASGLLTAAELVLCAALQVVLGREPEPAELEYAHAVTWHETRDGTALARHNWGAVQMGTPQALGFGEDPEQWPRFAHGGRGVLLRDHFPDGRQYGVYFRRYPSALAGARAAVHAIYVQRPAALEAARVGDLRGFVGALYSTRYFTGRGRTPAERRALYRHGLCLAFDVLGYPEPGAC